MFADSKKKLVVVLCVLSSVICFADAGNDARLLSGLFNDNSKICPKSNFGNLALTRLANGRAYYFSTTQIILTWIQAEEYCRTRNMYLVSINNAQEYELILSQLVALGMNTLGTYLGLSDRLVEGIWRWTDGSFPTVQYWAAAEPIANAAANNCARTAAAATTPALSWVTNTCAIALAFVCEVPDNCSYKVTASSPVINAGK